MPAILVCVPNFSECRDALKIDAIAQAMRGGGVYILDRHMDADHNRSVITLAGDPEAVEEAAIRGVGKAAELIDLRQHQGVHPRIGATDVVPFIPVHGLSMEQCAAIARQAGERIWRLHRIPVYLYEAAATSPERRNLADVRRGQFEGIRSEIATTARRPDLAISPHSTAGITAVGARTFLIAYNIFPEHARRRDRTTSRAVGSIFQRRLAGGEGIGLSGAGPGPGFDEPDRDFTQTPIVRVFEKVREEAEKRGVALAHSELIGLIPRQALDHAPSWFLATYDFQPQILENRLERAIEESAKDASGKF